LTHLIQTTIGPGEEVLLDAPYERLLSKEDLASITSGRTAFYLDATIRFTDVFRRKRFVKFRTTYGEAHIKGRDFRMDVCDESNTTSESD
jgi:hypothetical protein